MTAQEQELARQAQRALGRRLREIRKAAGLSLQAVEEKSAGVWKAAAVGTYERGERAMTVHRLVRLCDWYGVTIWEVVPGPPQVDALIAQVEARAEARADARVAETKARVEREQRAAARQLAARMLGQVAATIIADADVDSPEASARQAAAAVIEAAGFTAVNLPAGSGVAG